MSETLQHQSLLLVHSQYLYQTTNNGSLMLRGKIGFILPVDTVTRNLTIESHEILLDFPGGLTNFPTRMLAIREWAAPQHPDNATTLRSNSLPFQLAVRWVVRHAWWRQCRWKPISQYLHISFLDPLSSPVAPVGRSVEDCCMHTFQSKSLLASCRLLIDEC